MLTGLQGRLRPAATAQPRPPRAMSVAVRASSAEGEPLRLVFVSTEVAPWSKVGGLADVLASLPAALAARGHTVVTVAPRYAPYPDTAPTGIAVPLELPPGCGAAAEDPPEPAAELPAPPKPRRRRGRRRRGEEAEGEVPEASPSPPPLPPPPPEEDSAAAMPSRAELFSARQAGVERVFVDHPALRTANIYGGTTAGGGGALTYMEAGALGELELRYSILCQAALGAAALLLPETEANGGAAAGAADGSGVVFVANDWPTALLLLRLQYVVRRWRPGQPCSEYTALLGGRLASAATAFCIHNLAYQGVFSGSLFPNLCLPRAALPALDAAADWGGMLRPAAALEAAPCGCPPAEPCTCPGLLLRPLPGGAEAEPPPGGLNFMRAALLSADEVVTVSPGYAREIQTQEAMACGMQDILVAKGVTGIMNGIDTEEWNPRTDPFLPREGRFGPRSFPRGKAHMKAALQRRLGLDEDPDAALAVFVGRLTEQKGLDVLLGAVPAVLAGPPAPAPRRLGAPPPAPPPASRLQLAMLGTGEAWMQAALDGLARSFPGRAVGVTAFSEELAHWMLAAADYALVPSRFEPCGLVAQCGARYGAVPVVTAVGGLADLVGGGGGHALSPLAPPGDAAARAADVRRMAEALRGLAEEAGSDAHRALQRRCMRMQLSWEAPAEEWEALLRRAAEGRRRDAA